MNERVNWCEQDKTWTTTAHARLADNRRYWYVHFEGSGPLFSSKHTQWRLVYGAPFITYIHESGTRRWGASDSAAGAQNTERRID